MRYNQLFSSMVTVTTAADISLHAGDAIYVDSPELATDTKNDKVSRQSGGLYIISDMCHHYTPKGTFTQLNLVRDSIGRKEITQPIALNNHERKIYSATHQRR